MPLIQIGDVELYYEAHGEGEPLILIPGFVSGLWLWFKQSEVLARRFRTIVFDPRGVGRSEGGRTPETIRGCADDVAALLSALGVERAHVLGVSFGGFVAQEFALTHPRNLGKLVLCCTSYGGARHLPPSASTLQAMASPHGLNTEERTRKNLRPAFAPEFLAGRPEEVEEVTALRLRHPVGELTHLAQVQAAATFDAEARVSRIEAPTLVVTGDEDAIVPPENSRHLAASIPGARLTIIEGAGHMVFIERAEEFNRAVVGFLDERPATRP
ncbi:MAG TPA: alpha/beta fold hydrolase [Pyrinomonadaceae bacterium]